MVMVMVITYSAATISEPQVCCIAKQVDYLRDLMNGMRYLRVIDVATILHHSETNTFILTNHRYLH